MFTYKERCSIRILLELYSKIELKNKSIRKKYFKLYGVTEEGRTVQIFLKCSKGRYYYQENNELIIEVPNMRDTFRMMHQMFPKAEIISFKKKNFYLPWFINSDSMKLNRVVTYYLKTILKPS